MILSGVSLGIGNYPWEDPAPAPARDSFTSSLLLQGHATEPQLHGPTLRAAQAASLGILFGKTSFNPPVLGAVSEERVLT